MNPYDNEAVRSVAGLSPKEPGTSPARAPTGRGLAEYSGPTDGDDKGKLGPMPGYRQVAPEGPTFPSPIDEEGEVKTFSTSKE